MAKDTGTNPIDALLAGAPAVVNIGLDGFADELAAQGADVVALDWRPPAGGDAALAALLADPAIDAPAVDAANREALDILLRAEPVLVDVAPALEAIPALAEGRKILHAGPPIDWARMCGPMRGAVAGIAVFEGWAEDLDDAAEQAAAGAFEFHPNHHFDAVGPMTGMTTRSQPVMVVENRAFGNRAFCTINEGLGKVMRFGGNDASVLARLAWLRDVLGPLMGRALRDGDGIALKNLIARGLTMGDEMHQRNVACSGLLLRALAPALARAAGSTSLRTGATASGDPSSHASTSAATASVGTPAAASDTALAEALAFVGGNDQFFLNVAMACGKSITDPARGIAGSSVVTAMARNGTDFGIRVAGTGDRWFTAPVEMPEGLYFPGFTEADANPDMGDSTIVETIGLGGFAMGASPAVAGFVGAGAASEAPAYTRRMREITVGENPEWTIPAMDYTGVPTAIDVRRVVETGLAPTINTGIAHREPGVGQVGAGVVRAPLDCFAMALRALADEAGER